MRRAGRLLVAALLTVAVTGCGGGEPATTARPAEPVAPADLVAIGAVADPARLAEPGLDLASLPAEAELVGPNYAIALAGVAVTDQLSYDQLREINLHRLFPEAEALPLVAGDGREFLIVPLTAPEDAATLGGGDLAEVTVAGEVRPLDRVPHELEVLVVNVPAGADAILSITDAGETKSISLRTGERADGGSDRPAETLTGGSVQLEEGVVINGVTQSGYYDGLTIRVALAATSHTDELGTAPDGSMWLEIELGLSYAGLVAQQARLELAIAESLTITGSDGTEVELPADTAEATISQDGTLATIDWSGVAEVPDDLRSFSVAYTTRGRFVGPDGQAIDYTRTPVTPTGTIELAER
ncbi:MAG TPA: hypothetical protein VIL37_05045 [Natronosporangium sp.]